MHLDPETCERARLARDPRFDGRLFIGVRSTGIYCRPICRVRPPRRRNVVFYPSAAAAEAAGFRPCRRCRPESAPGTPAWRGHAATVARALRLIEAGALDGAGRVETLAERLGVGERHLRRLFALHLGASPLAVARTRRTHFARRLLDESEWPVAQVALAAGFGSVRQFNAAIRSTFHCTPSQLRAARGAGGPADGAHLRLALRPPFDWQALLQVLTPRAIPGVECVVEGRYRRLVGERSAVEVSLADPGDAVRVRVLGEPPADLIGVAARVRRLFDLSADPDPIARDLGSDPVLAARVRSRPGMRVLGAWDPFESAVRVVLGQQVTVAGATTLAGRLVESFGKPLETSPDPALTHLFPEPGRLARARLEAIGLPRARAESLRALARAVSRGELRLDGAAPVESALAALTALPGIGPWSAQLIAMRALGDPDAFPAGDLGLRKALGRPGAPASASELEERAEAWRPWRSYAAQWLWSEPPGPARPSRSSRPSRPSPRARSKPT